jgi:hypothetical protein
MENYKPITLKQDFSSRSSFIQLASRFIWSWGMIKTPKTREGKVVGATAPLWLNPSTFFYKMLCFFTFLCFLLFIAGYIFLRFYNKTNQLSSLSVRDYSKIAANATYTEFMTQTDSSNSTELSTFDAYCMFRSFNELSSIFILVGGIIMFLSFLHAMYLGCYLDYAADNEWSRNLVLNLIIWGGQVGIIIGDFIYSAGLISFYNTNYDDTSIKVFSASSPTCNTLNVEDNRYREELLHEELC